MKKRTKSTRKIGGKLYHTAGVVFTRRDAKQLAKNRRETGIPTRVVKVKGGYKVYYKLGSKGKYA